MVEGDVRAHKFSYVMSDHAAARYAERFGKQDADESFGRSIFHAFLYHTSYYRDGKAIWIVRKHDGQATVETVITIEQFESLFDERGVYIGRRNDGTTLRDRDFHLYRHEA